MLILLVLACAGDPSTPPTGKTDSPVVDTDSGSPVVESEAPVEESCNGEDDDGDGAIDEDYDDYDVDGVADCVDDACDVDTLAAGEVALNDACPATSWTDDGSLYLIEEEWEESAIDFYHTPIVSNLTDDDGDGDIDLDDIPDLVGVEGFAGRIYICSGDGSGCERLVGPTAYGAGIAAADIDGDGVANLITADNDEICALEPDGSPLWCIDANGYQDNGGPVITDLEGDGVAEVVVAEYILDGPTGAILTSAICPNTDTFPTAGDLDGDGVQEIVCGRSAYHADGTEYWNHAGTGIEYLGSAIVDVDLDGVPEVVVSGTYLGIELYSYDGTLLAAADAGGVASAPCVADFNGDGLPEFGVAEQFTFKMFDRELNELWTTPIFEEYGWASCAGFDFDADGAYEVVYNDNNTLYVWDGGTGTERMTWTGYVTAGLAEYPVVADIDRDGQAEIVFPRETYDYAGGFTALGSPTGSWPPASAAWPHYGFDGASVSDAGEVLAHPPDPWRDGGFSHARPPGEYDAEHGTWSLIDGLPDLGVTFVDACAADCEDGPIAISLSAHNASAATVDAVVSLIALFEDEEREIDTALVSLAPGSRSEPILFALDLEEQGALGWRATIARADGGEDCDPTDNVATNAGVGCPW